MIPQAFPPFYLPVSSLCLGVCLAVHAALHGACVCVCVLSLRGAEGSRLITEWKGRTDRLIQIVAQMWPDRNPTQETDLTAR